MDEERELAPEAGPENEEAQKPEVEGQDETPAAEEPVKEPEEEEKKRQSAKERRDREKAYKQRLRTEAQEANERAERAEARAKSILDAGKSTQAPKEGDYTDYAEYVARKAVWAATQEFTQRDAGMTGEEAKKERERAKEISAQERQETYKAYEEAKVEARSRYTDFDAVVGQPGLFPTGSHLPDLVLDSDMAPDLAYAVASDKALHDRLLRMPPVEAARELGRIEATLAAPRPKTQTQAPTPITPVSSRSSGQRDPEKMTMEEWVAFRKKGR